MLARDEELPSGDELGAEFERFLAQQADGKFGEGFTDGDDSNSLTGSDRIGEE